MWVRDGRLNILDYRPAGSYIVALNPSDFDRIPPVTRLVAGAPSVGTDPVVVGTATTLSFEAADTGSAVAATFFSLDGSSFAAGRSLSVASEGAHRLDFYSEDLAGNRESTVTANIVVDATPPEAALAALPEGWLRGLVSVAGTATDLHFSGWRLESSSAGVAGEISSSTELRLGAFLAAWDTARFPDGAQILSLTATDALGLVSASTRSVTVDNTPPVSILNVGEPRAVLGGRVVLSSSTPMTWQAEDPLVRGSSSGVAAIFLAVSASSAPPAAAAFVELATAPVFLSGADGERTFFFFARDHAGNEEPLRSVTVLLDSTPPEVVISSPSAGALFIVGRDTVPVAFSVADAADPAPAFTAALVQREDRGTPRGARPDRVAVSSASFLDPRDLDDGLWEFEIVAADFVRNSTAARSGVFEVVHDSEPPRTALLVDGLAAGSTNLILSSTATVGFAATDAGAGVLEISYALDGSTVEAVFVSTFSLSVGTHTLAYRSVDRAGNAEDSRLVSISVTSPSSDTTPPLARLDFPGASALGVERAVGGIVTVRGSAVDASALTWTLSVGSAVLVSGSGNISGALASWDTTSLSGSQTLTLSAVDGYGNAASTTATVFVGAPVFTFAVGRKDSDVIVNTLKGPTGIAVRSDGSVWVASIESDKILLISPAGVLLGAAGSAPGRSGKDKKHGKKDKDEEDHDDRDRRDEGGLRFKSPQGLALDAADNLYVADRDLDRVVKLSPDGQVLLREFGKKGSGPGELRRPFDAAVDGNGDVYAADSGNRRISVFNSSGTYLRQFGPGVLLSTSEIRGIALTAEGLWVSDKESERIYLFSRAGELIKSIGGSDSVVGEISRTRGLAADRLGALYVVEPNRDRAQKFDPQGKGLLAFGSKAGLSHADKHAKRYLTEPHDAAVAPDGSLWITDAGRDRIVRYALPVSGYSVASYSTGGGASGSVEPARRVVDHKDGATVSRDDGAGVHVPKGALEADLEITVDKGDEEQDKEEKTANRREMKVAAVSEEVQYGPEGTTFNAPVTLTIPYDASLIASQGIREDELKVYYWNPTLKDWQAMPSVVDKENKTVNAETNHFSGYQVHGPGGGIGVAATIDEFRLRDVYAFPNPSRNGSAVVFRIQPGLADSVEVRVYGLSGRKIHSSSDFRLSVLDDGNGKGAQNTYDHSWSVSGVGSGVYTFVITAKKSGQADIRKSGRVGVIK